MSRDPRGAGVTAAMLVILLLSLPFLPLMLLVAATVRVRDAVASVRAARQDAGR